MVAHVIILLLSIIGSLQAAIPHGTLVKKLDAHVPVQSLKVGDRVASSHPTNKQFSLSIQEIYPLHESKTVTITCEKGSVTTSHDQLFYDPMKMRWVHAADLTTDNSIIDANLRIWKCTEVKQHSASGIFYEIELEEPHTFFISEHEFLVHNFTGVEVTLSFAFGAGEFVLSGISAGVIAVGCWLGFINSKIREETRDKSDDRPSPLGIELDIQVRNPHALSDAIFSPSEQEAQAVKPEEKTKSEQPGATTVEELIADAKPGEKTTGRTTQFEKPGGYEDAEKDFERLQPTGVKDFVTEDNSGKTGILPGKRKVTVRTDSSDSRATLEIHHDETKQKIKIRYGDKR